MNQYTVGIILNAHTNLHIFDKRSVYTEEYINDNL